MNDIKFSWDKNKAQSNLIKHRISFDEAQTVFDDENARLIFDPDHSNEEDIIYEVITNYQAISCCNITIGNS